MANRRFEMYQYRQVLTRMRLGDSDRAIARSGLMGRRKAGALRDVAVREEWLETSSVLPADVTLEQIVQSPSSRPQSASSVLPFQDKVTAWWRQGIRGTVIHQALVDTYGSYFTNQPFKRPTGSSHWRFEATPSPDSNLRTSSTYPPSRSRTLRVIRVTGPSSR